MSRFSDIDLKDLPAPSIIEAVAFEDILAARMADAPLQAARINAPYTAATLETDPIRIDQRVSAFREMGLRQKYNDDVKGVFLASSWGSNLDQVASDLSVKRLTITPADPAASPPAPTVYESDDALRERRRLAPEALSTAGPEGAYLYFAKSVVDAQGVSLIKSVAVYGPHDRFAAAPANMRVVSAANALAEVMTGTQQAWLIDDGASAAPRRYRISPGFTHVVVLGAVGDGTVTQPVLDAVAAAVNSDNVRPIGDFVVVLAASVQHYSIQANLIVGGGADAELVRLQAVQRLNAYALSRHAVGKPVYHAALDATAIVTNAQGLPIAEQAIVSQPPSDLDAGAWGACYCDSVTVSVEVQHD